VFTDHPDYDPASSPPRSALHQRPRQVGEEL